MTEKLKVVVAVALVFVFVGEPAYGYRNTRTRTVYYAPVPTPPAKQVVSRPTYSFADPTATGSAFTQNLQRTTRQNREKSIRAFLNRNGLWGASVLETRDNFKIAIKSADEKLVELRRSILLAGGKIQTDSRYRAAKASRDNLDRKLQALDERIMNALVNKSTGDVAKQLIFSEEDRAAANAAIENLRQAERNYGNQANDLLRRSNW